MYSSFHPNACFSRGRLEAEKAGSGYIHGGLFRKMTPAGPFYFSVTITYFM
jgi:hypothetical protein